MPVVNAQMETYPTSIFHWIFLESDIFRWLNEIRYQILEMKANIGPIVGAIS